MARRLGWGYLAMAIEINISEEWLRHGIELALENEREAREMRLVYERALGEMESKA